MIDASPSPLPSSASSRSRSRAERALGPLRFLLASAVFAVLLRTSDAQAQAEEVPARYQELVAQAIEESAQGRWDEAHRLFRAAHLAYPNARSFRGLAMTAFEIPDYVTAVISMRAALASEVRPLTAEQRVEGEALLRRAEVFVGRFTTSDYPDDAVFVVDEVRVELAPGRLLVLPLGRHMILASWGDTRAHATVRVQGSELEALELIIDRPPQTATEPVQLAVPPPAALPAPAPNHRALRLGGWTLLGAGSAGLVVGSVLLGLGRADAHRVENAATGTPWTSLELDYAQARVRSGVGYGTLALGLTSAAVGLGLALSNSDSDDHPGDASRRRATVRAVLLPSAARLEVSF